ncbi:putative capsular polysaccharide synthesis family protein [Psychroserpens sp. MEBiC05023]
MKAVEKYKRTLLGFLKSFYPVDKFLYLRHLSHSRMHSDDFILIYTMGKVASTSVFKSLKKTFPNRDIFHLHRLNSSYLNEREQMIKREFFGKKQYSKHLTTDLLWKPQWVKAIVKKKDFETLKLITIVREPISRNISLFFQWIDFNENEDSYNFKSRNRNYPFNVTTPKHDLSKLYELFYNKFVVNSHLEWLDSEMKHVFNLNLLDISFDKSKGYTMYNNDDVELLVLKLESMNDCFQIAMKGFFNQDIELMSANIAANKDIHKVYVDFKKQINLPKDYLNQIYDSNYMKHFYTESEINSYKNKWFKN